MSYESNHEQIRKPDESEVRRHLKPISTITIILVIILALGVLMGLNSYSETNANFNAFIAEVGADNEYVPFLKGILTLLITELVLNAVLLGLMIYAMIMFNKTKLELTNKKLKDLKLAMLVNGIVAIAFFGFEIYVIVQTQTINAILGQPTQFDIVAFVMQAARLALYVVLYLSAHKSADVLKKMNEQIIEPNYNN